MEQGRKAPPGIAIVKTFVSWAFQAISLIWHGFCRTIAMKAKTLFYCPRDEEVLLFEEVYDERLDFVYQPLSESPRICPRCGRAFSKNDCVTVEELYRSDNMFNSAEA